jgi:hypothetical protein
MLLACGPHRLDRELWSRWCLVHNPGGLPIWCLYRTSGFDVEHGFLQPLGLLHSRELRQITPVPFMEGDLQVAASVGDLDHDVIEEPFLNEIPSIWATATGPVIVTNLFMP